jgi:hypothetical protein
MSTAARRWYNILGDSADRGGRNSSGGRRRPCGKAAQPAYNLQNGRGQSHNTITNGNGTNGHYRTATGASVQQTAGGGQARGGGGLGSTSRGGNAQGGSGYDSRYYRADGKLKTNGHSGVAYLEWELEQ